MLRQEGLDPARDARAKVKPSAIGAAESRPAAKDEIETRRAAIAKTMQSRPKPIRDRAIATLILEPVARAARPRRRRPRRSATCARSRRSRIPACWRCSRARRDACPSGTAAEKPRRRSACGAPRSRARMAGPGRRGRRARAGAPRATRPRTKSKELCIASLERLGARPACGRSSTRCSRRARSPRPPRAR